MTTLWHDYNDRNNLLSISKYIVDKHNIKLSVKLQKILYFLFLEYLKETNQKFFEEEFEAWVYGPVIPEVFYFIKEHGFDFSEYYDYKKDKLITIESLKDNKIKQFIDGNIKKYKRSSTEELVEKSHKTMPWIKARKGLPDNEPSNEKIKFNDLKKFKKEWSFL